MKRTASYRLVGDNRHIAQPLEKRHSVGLLFPEPLYPRKNATDVLGQEMAGLGLEGPAMIMARKSAIRQLTDTWKTTLADAKIEHSVFPFGGECSLAEIERAKTMHGSATRGKVYTARAVADDLALAIRACARRIATLNQLRTQTKSQLHAAQQAATTPDFLLADLHRSIAHFDAQIEYLRC